ncbi:GGDEF domain-containing phosphodiesterase [Mycobacterium sp. 852002-51961_SCH5331710]|uniref:putative bifunctional diguanylate cyclase/phosphodiesterase n=1 Tax=Mycobacterium sp. 852002-51961_SCH5331710 TaxID=1834105 RepID=UPI0007FEF467|nr:GGDEF domain-containing phosphodiesterase [Mycobacterium sp. 852002-51961_SCH5331710]OBB47383.1 diguanylate phosphodiesterase [Mycobacterium sp. 852002-51961_SCH5331710]
MSLRDYRLRWAVLVAMFVVVSVNALAPWGRDVATALLTALQAVVGIAILVIGFSVARRVSGASRWWRILIATACLSWQVGELMWWAGGGSADGRVAGVREIIAYLLPAVLIAVAVVVLGRADDETAGSRDHPAHQHSAVASVLDGVVAAISFSLLSYIAGYGGLAAAAFPRSNNPAVLITYSLLQLCAVVAAVYFAIIYPAGRPYRANCLLLSGGVVVLTSADRMVAYFRTVDVGSGELWAGGAFVIGLVLVTYAMAELEPSGDAGERVMDYVQLTLPYVGFAGMAMLYAYHVLIGKQLDAVLVSGAVMMVLLVAARQVFAMRTQKRLTVRLYDAQRRLAHQVHHDALTGLPNRLLFGKRLETAVASGDYVLIFVDLDDFKDVNDRFGHAGGDELLRAVGDRLRRCVADTDTLARIGGDEFAILIKDGVTPPEVVADRIRAALREPFVVHGSTARVRASMGLVRLGANEDGQTPDDMLRKADQSMYEGKRLGKDIAVVYPSMLGLAADFPSALRRADGGPPAGFALVFQPIVRLPEATPVAVEALARWTAPDGAQIPPETFVAAAEAAGLGGALDAMILDLGCREIISGGTGLELHVNIGAARLRESGFVDVVSETLTRYGMESGRLTLEITETVPIFDLDAAAAQILRLNAIGVKVALDDFGAGYNSLTYLHSLPVDAVKLDRSLLAGTERARDATLYRSVIAVCNPLGLDVVAEGIETDEQADMVIRAGCRFAQGYLFGRPTVIVDRAAEPLAADTP